MSLSLSNGWIAAHTRPFCLCEGFLLNQKLSGACTLPRVFSPLFSLFLFTNNVNAGRVGQGLAGQGRPLRKTTLTRLLELDDKVHYFDAALSR
jgi:hypothetical protein